MVSLEMKVQESTDFDLLLSKNNWFIRVSKSDQSLSNINEATNIVEDAQKQSKTVQKSLD